MQFNLCMTQPIVEGHDDTVREGAYATTTKAFAVLNQKNTIRNRRVFSVGTVHDVWIYSHDAPWKQIRKGKRVFTANLGVEKTWSSRTVSELTRRAGAAFTSFASGAIDGMETPSGRLSSQVIHSLGSVSEVSRAIVRFEGSRTWSRVMSSRL